MNKCLLCQQLFSPPFSFYQVFFGKDRGQMVLCPHCRAKFERLKGPRCPICARASTQPHICADCQAWRALYGTDLLRNHSFYAYNQAVHDLMVRYKRYGDYVLYRVLQSLCRAEIKQLPAYDFYVPIPTAPEHRQRRQFDTVQAIFAGLLPLTILLSKHTGSRAQGQKNKRERLQTKQSFYLNPHCPLTEKMTDGSFLLLDDIYTTGRTLYHARDKIRARFPRARIESLAICR